MSKKESKHLSDGVVYSTDPDFSFEESGKVEKTLPPAEQHLRVRIDTKHRKGKAVTLVEGFIGTKEDLEALGKRLKAACGVGGSAKDDFILIQGERVKQVIELLREWGYGVK